MRICWRFSKGLGLPRHPDRRIHAGGYFGLFGPQCAGSKGEAALTARPLAFAMFCLEFDSLRLEVLGIRKLAMLSLLAGRVSSFNQQCIGVTGTIVDATGGRVPDGVRHELDANQLRLFSGHAHTAEMRLSETHENENQDFFKAKTFAL